MAQKVAGPDLTKYMDKQLVLKLNGNRTVGGVLRGFDQFMNIVLDDTIEMGSKDERNPLGTTIIRGKYMLEG